MPPHFLSITWLDMSHDSSTRHGATVRLLRSSCASASSSSSSSRSHCHAQQLHKSQTSRQVTTLPFSLYSRNMQFASTAQSMTESAPAIRHSTALSEPRSSVPAAPSIIRRQPSHHYLVQHPLVGLPPSITPVFAHTAQLPVSLEQFLDRSGSLPDFPSTSHYQPPSCSLKQAYKQ